MTIKAITPSEPEWEAVKQYARDCSWSAGPFLAKTMDVNQFSDWERVVAAFDGDQVCGYCTVAKTDCIPNVPYTPYIGFVFVGEPFRGKRLSEKLIAYSKEYLKAVGFQQVYLVSDHENLYEKYGFTVIDRKTAPWGSIEKIYRKEIL